MTQDGTAFRLFLRGGRLALLLAVRTARTLSALLRLLSRAVAAAIGRVLGTSRWVREADATTAELVATIDRLEAELAASRREIARLQAPIKPGSPYLPIDERGSA